MLTDVTRVPFIDRDELKILWRMLERLQADVTPLNKHALGGRAYLWAEKEIDALVIVMDAVKDSQMPPLFQDEKEGPTTAP
jgi:hypothetical protein